MISQFLRGARAKILELTHQSTSVSRGAVNLIFGNESCDLDSVVSALVYAWFLTQVHQDENLTHYFPVLNIHEKMFRLRTETTYLLKKFGVSQEDIIFRDTVDFKKFIIDNHRSNVKVTLVDHHILPRSDEYMLPFIKEVIDHRPQVESFDSSIQNEIAIVGSCVTLIAERIIKAMKDKRLQLDDREKEEIMAIISGPILLDTVNLLPAAGKVTERDINVVKYFWGQDDNPKLSELFKELSKAKFSSEGLSGKDLLLKDPKYIESRDGKVKVMFSTIHDTIEVFIQRDDSPACVSEMISVEKYSLWVGLAPKDTDEANKDFKPVILYSKDKDLMSKVNECLLSSRTPNLHLEATSYRGLSENFTCFRMCNVKASRKQVLPIVQNVIG